MVLVENVDGIRHERLRRLYLYWRSKQRRGLLPARRDLDVLEMKEWLGHLSLLEVERGGENFRYRLYGVTLVDYFGADRTNTRVSDLDEAVRETVRHEYMLAVQTRSAIVVERERTVRRRNQAVAKLLLPLAGDGVTVDMILGGVYMLDAPDG